MFDLITGRTRHMPRHQTVPIMVSTAAQLTAVGLIALSLLVATEQVSELPTMMAFVAPAPPPPPPPPPPAPKVEPQTVKPVPTSGAAVIPLEALSRIEPEPAFDGEEGVPEGVEGGIPGGVVGGIVGGVPSELPPPPPPPPPAPRAPIRIGGEIKPPTLLQRVEPVYPPLAAAAAIQGTVILEALVDEQGVVQDVKVLRSQGVLDHAAIEAVKQWRYSPVILNGRPEKFILTVVLSFRLEGAR
jgi:protein TonB